MDLQLVPNASEPGYERALMLLPKLECDFLSSKITRTARTKYSEEEDAALERFVSEHVDLKIAGNVLWREAARQRVTTHSWQSMRDRYLKRILPRMRQRQSQGPDALEAAPASGSASSASSPTPPVVPVAVPVRVERPLKRQRNARLLLPPLEPLAEPANEEDDTSSGPSAPAPLAPAQLMMPPGFLHLPSGPFPSTVLASGPGRMVACRVCCKVHHEPQELADLQIGCTPCRPHFHAMCIMTHWLRRWREDPETSPCCPVCGTMCTTSWQWCTLLRAAIKGGDEPTFDAVMAKGSPDLSQRCVMDMTMLHYCAANGTPAMIEELSARMPWALTATDAAGRTPFDVCPLTDVNVKRKLLPLPSAATAPAQLYPGESAADVLRAHGLRGLLTLLWGDLPRIDRHMGVETLLAAAFEGDWAEVLDILHAIGIPLSTFRKPCCDHCRTLKATPEQCAADLGRPRIAARLRELAACPE